MTYEDFRDAQVAAAWGAMFVSEVMRLAAQLETAEVDQQTSERLREKACKRADMLAGYARDYLARIP